MRPVRTNQVMVDEVQAAGGLASFVRKQKPASHRPCGPNDTERDFLLYAVTVNLIPGIDALEFEALRFRLTPERTYTPDWIDKQNQIAYEVKGPGPIRDDSIDKFLFARRLWPKWIFRMFRWTRDRGWHELHAEGDE